MSDDIEPTPDAAENLPPEKHKDDAAVEQLKAVKLKNSLAEATQAVIGVKTIQEKILDRENAKPDHLPAADVKPSQQPTATEVLKSLNTGSRHENGLEQFTHDFLGRGLNADAIRANAVVNVPGKGNVNASDFGQLSQAHQQWVESPASRPHKSFAFDHVHALNSAGHSVEDAIAEIRGEPKPERSTPPQKSPSPVEPPRMAEVAKEATEAKPPQRPPLAIKSPDEPEPQDDSKTVLSKDGHWVGGPMPPGYDEQTGKPKAGTNQPSTPPRGQALALAASAAIGAIGGIGASVAGMFGGGGKKPPAPPAANPSSDDEPEHGPPSKEEHEAREMRRRMPSMDPKGDAQREQSERDQRAAECSRSSRVETAAGSR